MKRSALPGRIILLGWSAAALCAAAAPWMTPAQREQSDRIAGSLIAPCCWRETVRVHHSPEANGVRESIEKQVLEGKSDAEIVEAFVSEYGERILREPRGQKAVWLNVIPLLFTAAGFGGLVWFVRRHTGHLHTAGGPEIEIPSSELE